MRAPADGVISQSTAFKAGQYVTAGTPLFSLVENGDTWVEANFKETQLTHMKVGQEAEIVLDTYPGHPFKAVVDSIGAGTGSEFSLLPAQNATGNWVKVTQRIPVRLKVEDAGAALALRTGMSADVSIDTGASRGFAGLFGSARGASSARRFGRTTRWHAAVSQATEVPHRGLITISIMLATIMQVLDTTIANVALPSMTGDLGASQDTITWVLTSYIVAAAIMTPVTGWLSDRFGRKELFLDLGGRLRRHLDGLRPRVEPGKHGAVPPAAGRVRRGDRAAVADLPARHQPEGAARLGDGHLGRRHHGRADHRADAGRLADRQLQLALGVLHQPAGRHPRLPRHGRLPADASPSALRGFDFFGFAMLSLGVGALQLMLDRGGDADWFASAEIWIELGLAIAGFWVFTVHLLTSRKTRSSIRKSSWTAISRPGWCSSS